MAEGKNTAEEKENRGRKVRRKKKKDKRNRYNITGDKRKERHGKERKGREGKGQGGSLCGCNLAQEGQRSGRSFR